MKSFHFKAILQGYIFYLTVVPVLGSYSHFADEKSKAESIIRNCYNINNYMPPEDIPRAILHLRILVELNAREASRIADKIKSKHTNILQTIEDEINRSCIDLEEEKSKISELLLINKQRENEETSLSYNQQASIEGIKERIFLYQRIKSLLL